MPTNVTLENIQKREFFRLYTDGGIVAPKGQAPGEGSIGVVLKNPDGSLIHGISARIGHVEDHHIAEYKALIAGLKMALGHGIEDLQVFIDSAMVEGQVNRGHRVRGLYLDCLRKTLSLKEQFERIEIALIPRKENSAAHRLADEALGRR